MCEKMEELKPTPRPLSLDDGWDQQVNGKAKRTDDQLEMEKKYRAEKEAQRQAVKRANRILRLCCLALALIAAGGVYMTYVEINPLWLSVATMVSGVALLFFTLGTLVGRRHR